MMAGVQQGIFERHGIKLELLFTTTSQEQRDGLASGDFQVAHAAVDNAVAMVERAKHDVIIVSGGDSSMNEFFVQADVRVDRRPQGPHRDRRRAQHRLRAAGQEDPAHERPQGLGLHGEAVGGTLFRYRAMREDKSHAASMLNPPFSIDAPGAGLKSLGRAVDLIGPYQATGAWVLRKWATANAETLERYLAAYIESARWAVAPANKDASVKMLAERFKLARRCRAHLGPARRSEIRPRHRRQVRQAGFRNVLALRAEIEGDWGGKPPAIERFVDLSYYEKAKHRVH